MVNVNSNFVMPLKSDFCLEKAGGIAETFLTAYQLLHLVGEVKSTDCVLVHAAGSGVGTSAIQLGIVHLSIARFNSVGRTFPGECLLIAS